VHRFFRHSLSLLAAGTFLGLPPPSSPAAEKRDTRPVLDPPPPALPQTLSVPRGKRLDISLRIYGVQSEQLRYLIKTPPAHGKLSEPRPISREVSVVTYEPPEELAVTADRFSYSVQNHAGVSAPVEVTISIVDQPPLLAIANTVEFGELLAGNTVTKDIEVSNRGGGYVEGELEVDPPFRIEGRTKYRLQGGDYAYFKIVFAPSEGGLFRREIRYSSERRYVTTVVGTAQAPISVEPAKIELRHAPDSAVRTGAFEIVNRTAEELTFQLAGGTRLQLPPTVSVGAHGRAAVAVSARPEDVLAFEDEVRVESAGFSLSVPVRALKVGPILRVAQHSLALGRIDANRGTQASVEVENAGGTVVKVTGEIGAPFALLEPTFDLPPGQKKRLTLNVQPSEPRRYRTWLKLKGGPTNAELEVEAELVGDFTASRPAKSPRPTATPAPNPADLPPWMPDLNIARAIRVTAVTATSANIEWPAELNSATQYRAERQVLTRDSARALRIVWMDVPKTTFTQQGPLRIAHLTTLQPQQSQTIRIVPLNPEGKPETMLFKIDFDTPPRLSLPKPGKFSLLFATLAVGVALLVWRRLRRSLAGPISGF
jgi:hypothetical protein